MAWTLVVLTSLVIIVLIAALYWYAVRLKRGFDTPSTAVLAAQGPLSFALSEKSTASLAHLSREPILIKLSTDGLRVQLDNRPLVPISILTDLAAAAALREIVADVSQSYGARWTALVTTAADGSIRVQRLA
jgi:hypothetical protein